MKYLVLAAALLCACEDETVDSDEVKAAKAECQELLKHIVRISPQGQGQEPGAVAGALPIEDIQGCVAAEPEMRACMLTAKDVPAVKTCIPPGEVLDCMHAVASLKKTVHEQAKASHAEPNAAFDVKLDAVRARCWAGEVKLAWFLVGVLTAEEQLKTI